MCRFVAASDDRRCCCSLGPMRLIGRSRPGLCDWVGVLMALRGRNSCSLPSGAKRPPLSLAGRCVLFDAERERRERAAILGLGGSIATPPEGIEADVVVVTGFDELRERSTDVRGRIVLFNAPFTTYSDTVAYRTGGPRSASQLGAVAALVRAVLDNESGPARDIVLLNTGVALYAANVAPTMADGLALAREAIASGKAAAKMVQFVDVSKRLAG